ncbi:MAG: uracil phosphoribosyltransferase [Candidatus Eremiobacteraeota bacterium]|nr:uracil phosphoribosyltransferase [Candidatus Eremiobacteraeota bacterium]MBV8338715.1 uracil phosphoribosyltransferase [Candidatus Eremiobacteraeota bacterium]MBV8460308.1 uracil phosphoribosyltransferase [Candidatus Eremiobacteraeota bacterium]MBV8670749.1 uracil phosphoribosyltransferase [Candidatus Eremiobacteraeota bacterium]
MTRSTNAPKGVYTHPDFPRLHLVDHPLVADKLGRLRDAATPNKEFRELCAELATLLAWPATADLEVTDTQVATPLDWSPAKTVSRVPLLVPILRAGLGLVPGFHALMPQATVAHIGVYRDPDTLGAVPYYVNLPGKLEGWRAFVLDPMLATGASAVATISLLLERGARIEDLRYISLIAAPEGVQALFKAHPQIGAFTCAVDRHLNDHGYIVPGLGDAGDRLFGAGAGRIPEVALHASLRTTGIR